MEETKEEINLDTEMVISGYKYLDEDGDHMHTFNGVPLIGTSSVGNVLSKPLTWWASGLAVMELGITDSKLITKIKNKTATEEEMKDLMDSVEKKLEQIKKMDVKKFYALLDRAYRAHSVTLKDKAEEGTDLHAELERFVKNTMLLHGTGTKDVTVYEERIKPFIDWTRENVDHFLWSEAHCFSEKMWTGGISDVGAVTKDKKNIIIDFKSSKDAYLSQYWQCVGYAMQIEENGWLDRNGKLLGTLDKPIDYVCIVPFGAPKVEPKFYYDMPGGKEAFLAELVLYKKLNI